jgi:hypothetical protein
MTCLKFEEVFRRFSYPAGESQDLLQMWDVFTTDDWEIEISISQDENSVR